MTEKPKNGSLALMFTMTINCVWSTWLQESAVMAFFAPHQALFLFALVSFWTKRLPLGKFFSRFVSRTAFCHWLGTHIYQTFSRAFLSHSWQRTWVTVEKDMKLPLKRIRALACSGIKLSTSSWGPIMILITHVCVYLPCGQDLWGNLQTRSRQKALWQTGFLFVHLRFKDGRSNPALVHDGSKLSFPYLHEGPS